MKTLDTKQNILDDAGFAYNFDRMVYFNRKRKKIFSVEFVDDQPEEVLDRKIREDTGGKEWKFYFNRDPSERAKREIEAALG